MNRETLFEICDKSGCEIDGDEVTITFPNGESMNFYINALLGVFKQIKCTVKAKEKKDDREGKGKL